MKDLVSLRTAQPAHFLLSAQLTRSRYAEMALMLLTSTLVVGDPTTVPHQIKHAEHSLQRHSPDNH